MAGLLERSGKIDDQLAKIFVRLLGSAILNVDKGKCALGGSDKYDEVCKPIAVLPKECVMSPQSSNFDKEYEKTQTGSNSDPTLGRPRYQWKVPESCTSYEKDRRKSSEIRNFYSVYVGHLPVDITEGELVDLFKDIGEVVESFVCPTRQEKGYTYGFVRFTTLDEAKDAVREKNMKVLGTKQIHVELASETRRKLQDNDDDDEKSQLLRKDYPQVMRRPANVSDDKIVMAKLKTSLGKLKANNSTSWVLGEFSVDEVFENLKVILKMLINYPMTLTDASADEEHPLIQENETSAANQCNPLFVAEDADSFAVGQDLVELNTASRFPYTQALHGPKKIKCETVKDQKSDVDLSAPDVEKPCLETAHGYAEPPFSEHLNSTQLVEIQAFLSSCCNDSESYSEDYPTWEEARENLAPKPNSRTSKLNISQVEQPTQVDASLKLGDIGKETFENKQSLKLTSCCTPLDNDSVFSSDISMNENQMEAVRTFELGLSQSFACDNPILSPSNVVNDNHTCNSDNHFVSPSTCMNDDSVESAAGGMVLPPTISNNNSGNDIELPSVNGCIDKYISLDNTQEYINLTSEPESYTAQKHLLRQLDEPTQIKWQTATASVNDSLMENMSCTSDTSSCLTTNTSSNILSRSNNFNENANQGVLIKQVNRSQLSKRRGCALAPSFAKPLRTSECEKDVKSSVANFSVTKNCVKTPKHTRPFDTLTENTNELTNLEVKATGLMMDDSAILSISPDEYDSHNYERSAMGLDAKTYTSTQVEKMSPDKPGCSVISKSDLDTIKLKKHLKEQHEKLEKLQITYTEQNDHRQRKSRTWFDNNLCLGSEHQIHDAEVTLQKKMEIWSSRCREQELAYEKEMLQSDNKGVLAQLAREMKDEQIRNEITITQLKCKVLEMKLKQIGGQIKS